MMPSTARTSAARAPPAPCMRADDARAPPPAWRRDDGGPARPGRAGAQTASGACPADGHAPLLPGDRRAPAIEERRLRRRPADVRTESSPRVPERDAEM